MSMEKGRLLFQSQLGEVLGTYADLDTASALVFDAVRSQDHM